MNRSLRVVIADDHELIRSGIKALLTSIPGVELVGETGDGAELVLLADLLLPDVVITDISMPGMDGIAAIERIHAKHPRIHLVVLSMHSGSEFTTRAHIAGASAYLTKAGPVEDLERVMHDAMVALATQQ